jgi:DNA-binding MarR family transcriptional regulator
MASREKPSLEKANVGDLERLMRLIRASFQDMAAAANMLHADIGITASTRAVLEHLVEAGATTVPEIAKAKNVTRQHIQQLTDSLVAAGFADYAENPAHKRSQLVQLTANGRKTYAAIREREEGLLAAIAAGFAKGELGRTASVLTRFRDSLAVETATS